jgi:hypothetical protein
MTDIREMQEEIRAWFAGRIPDGWFTEDPEITVDRDEILVVGRIEPPEVEKGASQDARREAELGRIARFREETRDKRIGVALGAERRFRTKVSWGAECGETRRLFTTLSVPVMTRLRMPERAVLDTLVDAGVARSRSHALAWCVRLVDRHQGEWLEDLRSAFSEVERVRAEGPSL